MQIKVKQKVDQVLGYFFIILLFPFTRLLGITMRRDHSTNYPEKHPKRIVFIKLMGLGSLVVASDAITAMRVRFPRTRFILVTDENLGGGIAPFRVFDEIVRLDTDNLLHTFAGMARFLLRTWTWRRLWVIDLEVYSKLTTVFALLTMARNRFGFFLSLVPFRRYLNTHNIMFDQAAFLEDNYEHMARAVTGLDELSLPSPPKRPHESGKPYILLNNTCSGLALVRKLPDRTLAEICHWVLDHTPYDLALLGAPEDREEVAGFIHEDPRLKERKERILNYAGAAPDFASYYDFLREKGACLVTIDSGALHIARKLGLPTLSIWGPTDPGNYLKLRPGEQQRHLSYYLGVPCSPCVHRYTKLPCGGDNTCMKDIRAEAIIKMVQELLSRMDMSQSPVREITRSV